MTPFERIEKNMLRPWVAIPYLCFVTMSFLYFDQSIALYFHQMNLRLKLPFIHWLTHLGTGELYVAGLFILALYFRYVRPIKKHEVRCWFLWLCVFVPYFICAILKINLGRARPELFFDKQLYGFYGFHLNSQYWSFPSGHTSAITGLGLGLVILFPRYCYAFVMSGLLLISTRVLLTNHYCSDVLTTVYLTSLEIVLLVLVLRRKAWLTLAVQ